MPFFVYRLPRDDSCTTPNIRGSYKKTPELNSDKDAKTIDKGLEREHFQYEQQEIGKIDGLYSDYNSLTWDTLKKRRRQKSSAIKYKTSELMNSENYGSSLCVFKEDRGANIFSESVLNMDFGRKQIKKLDIYKSSPSFFNHSNSSYSETKTPQNTLPRKLSPSALQYTGRIIAE